MISGYINWAVARRARRPAPRAPSVRLPFNIDPFAKGYLYNAYALGILSARGLPDFAYGNYLQVFFPAAKLAGDDRAKFEFFPPLALRKYMEIGYLTGDTWDWRERCGENRRDLADRLIAGLGNGRYVQVFANEFFIPGTGPHLRQSHRHEHLLVGYDAPSATLLGACYLGTGAFGWARTPLFLFVEAMCSRRGRGSGGYNDNDFVVELAPKPITRLPADSGPLRTQLRAYLSAEDDPAAHIRRIHQVCDPADAPELSYWLPADTRGAFGFGVYPLFRNWLVRKALDGGMIDLRATRTLLEHKIVLRHVLRVLAEGADWKLRLLDDFEAAIAAARAIHTLAYEARRKPPRDRRNFADALTGRIDDLERTEADLLPEFLE